MHSWYSQYHLMNARHSDALEEAERDRQVSRAREAARHTIRGADPGRRALGPATPMARLRRLFGRRAVTRTRRRRNGRRLRWAGV